MSKLFSSLSAAILIALSGSHSMALSEEARGQVRDAALNELRGANMEEMTERKLRTALEAQLGLELGGYEERKFLRGIIEDFLDQDEAPREAEAAPKRRKLDEDAPAEETAGASAEAPVAAKEAAGGAKRQIIGDGNLLVCELSNNRKVTVSKWKNQKLVSIREYYEKYGEFRPGKKGISLTIEQWEVLRSNMDQIDSAVEEVK